MNIDLRCVDSTYSLSGTIATLSIRFQLIDLDQVDENGDPKVLDEKVISVKQNILDSEAKNNLKKKILDEVEDYLIKAKENIYALYAIFGTIDPNEVLGLLKSEIETDVKALVAAVFGGV